jgi:hypothetical protein
VLSNETRWSGEQEEDKHFSKICFVPSLGISCFGCCGHHFQDKKTMHKFFDRNSQALKKYKKDGRSHRDFMWREYLVSSVGGCYSLIREKDSNGRDQYVCAVHPLRIGPTAGMMDGDLREAYCDRNYLCKTAAHVNKMTDDERAIFYRFLKHLVEEEKMDNYAYSIMNSHETELLEKYREWKEKK